MAIIKYLLGERCSTKEAVAMLEAAEVLECIPHDVDPDARLTNAAIAMRRSEWWWKVPAMYVERGRVSYSRQGDYSEGNSAAGEIPWR